jgi:hypothetical protein
MKFLLIFALALGLRAADTRFLAVDVFIDPAGEPLAAYQLDFAAPAGTKIVGIEGGDHLEFRKAPYYDPKAIQTQRVIVAAFSTAAADQLPKTKTRLLTLHLETDSATPPKFESSLPITAKPNGQKFQSQITLSERK